MREAAVPAVRKLLASPSGEIAELWVRSFEDDLEAHDNALQSQLDRDFSAAFDEARSELTAAFGSPARAGEGDDEAVPLGGIFRFAVWSAGDRELWLAAAHEDRECPFLLLVGTSP